MKKQNVAWKHFCEALYDKKQKRSFKKPLPHDHPKKLSEKFFTHLVESLWSVDIPVTIEKIPAEPRIDPSGKTIHIEAETVCLFDKNEKPVFLYIVLYPEGVTTRVLCHEFAHAVDFHINGKCIDHECEFVASAAGYLFLCKRLGIYSPIEDALFAREHGAKLWMTKTLRKVVFEVFEEMDRLIPDFSLKTQRKPIKKPRTHAGLIPSPINL